MFNKITLFNNLKNYDIVLLFLPMLLGYSVSMFCRPDSNDGASVKFRPPSWVFGIVWPILYLLLGFSWVKSKQFTIAYILLNIFLNLWLIVYGCLDLKKYGIYLILFSLIVLLYIIIFVKKYVKFYLMPLFMWLLFALFLNIKEVQNK